MAYDGNGLYSRIRNWAADAAGSINIEAALHDTEDDSIETALNLAFLRDGRAPATAAWDLGGFNITNLGNATAGAHALNRTIGDGRYLNRVSMTASVGGSALTVALKSIDGGDPSASEPVIVPLRSTTLTSGVITNFEVTAALSVVVPSTATLGTINAIPFELWVILFSDGGMARLGIVNLTQSTTLTAINLFPSGLLSSTTVSTGADSAGVIYSDTGVTSKAFAIIGRLTFDSGQATAGTWATAPTTQDIFLDGMDVPTGVTANGPYNCSITASNGASALTIAIKQADGTDATPRSPVLLPFRSPTAGSGAVVWRPVMAAMSVSIDSTATVGTSNSVAFSVWVVAFDDAGTVRIGFINCLSGTNIYPLRAFGIASSTADGTGSDSAHVFYSAGAVTSKSYIVLGRLIYNSGLATAGTWNADPSVIENFHPGMQLPGDVMQRAGNADGEVATGTTTLPTDDTIPQITEGNQYMTQAITPVSAANVLRIEHDGQYASSNTAVNFQCALFQDATAGALVGKLFGRVGGSADAVNTYIKHLMIAGTTSATTFRIRAGNGTAGTTTFNGQAGGRLMGGVMLSRLDVEEIVA